MKQLSQKLKDGHPSVIDVPVPVLSKGTLLIQNAFSIISAGTEGSTVKAARKSLLGKAQERPQQAKQMVELLKQAGPVQAYRTLMKKLDSYSPLGYSTAGVVIGVGEGVSGFSIGDKVACGGAGASHAEVVVVPRNLCVKLKPDANLRLAAYNTVGAIALQGIRQADLRLGETCAVIGLGLLGQLACVLLRAAGIRVVAIDIDAEMVKLARSHAADLACGRTDVGLAEGIDEFTSGIGVDAVIITAATDSTDPVNFAGRMCKHKGKVVIVGNVPTGFDREPHYYKKELDLRMSCSYGPGRYDPQYEEKGIDYPSGYVRWTERRNMEAFQDLLHSSKINIDYLTTHVFKLHEASKAYDLITERTEPFIGLLIEYPELPAIEPTVRLKPEAPRMATKDVGIAFIGAGSYAMSHLLPNIPKAQWIQRVGVMTASGLSSRSVAERFDFTFCTSDEHEILQNERVNTVFVATRHDSHASYVKKALEHGKNVFVEKPLCITATEHKMLTDLLTHQESRRKLLMVGFNRRFSPLVTFIQQKLGSGVMAMNYRINAGVLPSDSWILDQERGGGRIIGEACHFIDLLTFLNGSLPKKVQAFQLADPVSNQDTTTINLSFENGSVGTIAYFANGPKNLPKEYLEIYRNGTTAIMRDFQEAEIYDGKATAKKKLSFQDKGQATMVSTFLNAVKTGAVSPIPVEEILAVTAATIAAVESARSGSVVSI